MISMVMEIIRMPMTMVTMKKRASWPTVVQLAPPCCQEPRSMTASPLPLDQPFFIPPIIRMSGFFNHLDFIVAQNFRQRYLGQNTLWEKEKAQLVKLVRRRHHKRSMFDQNTGDRSPRVPCVRFGASKCKC